MPKHGDEYFTAEDISSGGTREDDENKTPTPTSEDGPVSKPADNDGMFPFCFARVSRCMS